MSKGVQFDRNSAARIAAATRRVEQTPKGGNAERRGSQTSLRPVIFVLNEDMDAATDSLTDAAAARATVYASDPASPPVMATDRSTYTPQGLTTSTPARVEWVVNRSLDFSASAGAAGMAIWINGELLVFWVDCTSGT
jgi:hypothetical protein